MHETIPSNRRVYLTIAPAANGKLTLGLSYTPPDMTKAIAALISRGVLCDGKVMEMELASAPAEDPDVRALQSATLLGTVTISQTATVALAAGLRTVGVSIPAALKLKAGEPILIIPTGRVLGYAIHDAVAVSSTLISVTMTAPLLAIGASYSLPCKLIRLNI